MWTSIYLRHHEADLFDRLPARAAATARRFAAVLIYLGTAIPLFAFMSIYSHHRMPHWYPGVKPAHFRGPRFLAAWVRFDAGWYRDIAQHGYYYNGNRSQSSVPFFPAYPMLMRGLHAVLGHDLVTWGIPITFASGLTAAVLLYRWCSTRFSNRASLLAVVALCLWPYGFFIFGTVYADAMFLALALAAFALLEADRPLLAGLAGAVACATRPVGAAVLIGLIVVVWERRRRASVSPRARRDLWALTAAIGFAAYPTFLWIKFGNPFAFAVAEGAPGWDQKARLSTWLKFEYFKRVFLSYERGYLYPISVTFQLLLAVSLVVLVVKQRKRVGLGYTVFAVCVLAIPLIGSKDFQGVGRYSLAAFPAFGVVGDYLSRLRFPARVATIGTAALVLFMLSSAYARGSYIA